MATVFWDSEGVVLVDFLEGKKTVTGAYYVELTWANYGPQAKSGPRACLIWPACYYHERVLKSNSLLIVEYSFPFPYRKITSQCPSIRIN